MSGLEVHECGASLVYSDNETLENSTGWEEVLGGDLSGFQLSTGAYYLCRRDFVELMEVGRLAPDWFRILVDDTIDYTDVRGWRKTGRPKQMNSSSTELKTISCIIDGPELEDIYKIAEMSKSSIGDKPLLSTSNLLTRSESVDKAMEEIYEKAYASGDEIYDDIFSAFGEIRTEEPDLYPEYSGLYTHTKPTKRGRYNNEEQKESVGMSKAFVSDEIIESGSPPHEETLKSVVTQEVSGSGRKKIVLKVNLSSKKKRRKMISAVSALPGVESVSVDVKEGRLTVIGDVESLQLAFHARKIADARIISVGPVSEDEPGYKSEKDDEADEGQTLKDKKSACTIL